jgi:hypothetical protein
MNILLPPTIDSADILVFPPEQAGFTPWSQGSYDTEDKVIYNERLYESLGDNNRLTPEEGLVSSPLMWLDLGPSNKTAAFDNQLATRSERDDGQPLILRFRAVVPVSTLYLYGVTGSALTVRQYDGSGAVVWRQSPPLIDFTGHNSWYDVLFLPWTTRNTFLFTDLTLTLPTEIEIEITPGANGASGIGSIMFGVPSYIGKTATDPDLNILDLSKTDRDEFGDLEIVRRFSVPDRSFTVFSQPNDYDRINDVLVQASGRRVLLIATKYMTSLTTFGILRKATGKSSIFIDPQSMQPSGLITFQLKIEGVK